MGSRKQSRTVGNSQIAFYMHSPKAVVKKKFSLFDRRQVCIWIEYKRKMMNDVYSGIGQPAYQFVRDVIELSNSTDVGWSEVHVDGE